MTPESLSAMHAETHGDPGPAALDIERLATLVRDGWYKPGSSYPIVSVAADDWIKEVQALVPHLLTRLKAAETELDAYPKVGEDYAHKGYPCQWRRMTPAEVQALIDGDEAAAEIEALQRALHRISLLKPEPIPGSDFATGPAAILNKAREIARAALENRHG